MNLIIEKFQYLVIDTGYTSRLIKTLEYIEKELSKYGLENSMLYIEDNMCEHVFYEISSDREEIQNIRENIQNISGVFVFSCENLNDYCFNNHG
jgi:hypothetical protein